MIHNPAQTAAQCGIQGLHPPSWASKVRRVTGVQRTPLNPAHIESTEGGSMKVDGAGSTSGGRGEDARQIEIAERESISTDGQVWYWITHPVDWWWAWGEKTTYYVRVGPLRIPIWRTSGMPYEIRRAIKRGER